MGHWLLLLLASACKGWTRDYWLIYRGPGLFLPSYELAPTPPPPTPSPVSKLNWRHTGRLRKRDNLHCWYRFSASRTSKFCLYGKSSGNFSKKLSQSILLGSSYLSENFQRFPQLLTIFFCHFSATFGKIMYNFGYHFPLHPHFFFGHIWAFWQNFLPPGNSDNLLTGVGEGVRGGGGAKFTEGDIGKQGFHNSHSVH